MHIQFLIIILMSLLSGCATPPGKLTDNNFIIKKYSINIQVIDAVSNLYEGFRYCGPYSGGALDLSVTHHGIPDCAPIKSNGNAICDLYIGSSSGGRSDFVLGRIDFKPNKNGTSVELRVQSYAANTDDILKSWQMFIANKANKVCPKQQKTNT